MASTSKSVPESDPRHEVPAKESDKPTEIVIIEDRDNQVLFKYKNDPDGRVHQMGAQAAASMNHVNELFDRAKQVFEQDRNLRWFEKTDAGIYYGVLELNALLSLQFKAINEVGDAAGVPLAPRESAIPLQFALMWEDGPSGQVMRFAFEPQLLRL